MAATEKRIYTRVEVRWPVSLLNGEMPLQGETRDMSVQGAFIACPKPLRPDDRAILVITTPSGPMQVVAQVVWTSRSEARGKPPVGMGVRFIWSSI